MLGDRTEERKEEVVHMKDDSPMLGKLTVDQCKRLIGARGPDF